MAAEPDPPSSSSNRRAGDRIELAGVVRGDVLVYQPMTLHEISFTGAQIDTAFPLQLGSLHDIRLEVGDRVLVAKVRVVHINIAEVEHESVLYRSGVEFTALDQHVRRAIDEFVATLHAERRVP